jgi:hypothetical protein
MTELSLADTQALINYARQKFAEERFPLAPGLRPIREALARLDPKPALIPRPASKPHVPPGWRGRKARLR